MGAQERDVSLDIGDACNLSWNGPILLMFPKLYSFSSMLLFLSLDLLKVIKKIGLGPILPSLVVLPLLIFL